MEKEEVNLSPNFTLAELTASSTAASRGIDNQPGAEHRLNLGHLAQTLEQVRTLLGEPMIISSGYRSPALNKAVGGVLTSDHSQGLAADFVAPRYGEVMRICLDIEASDIPFDQLIFEQGSTEWVHIGIGPRMRCQVLSWSAASGYVNGIKRLQR